MRLDERADHIDAGLLHLVSAVEHRVGLSAAGRRAQVDREAAVADAHPVGSGLRVA